MYTIVYSGNHPGRQFRFALDAHKWAKAESGLLRSIVSIYDEANDLYAVYHKGHRFLGA